MSSKDRDERTRLNGSTQVPEVEAGPRFQYRTVVQVFVGPHEKRFDVHKEKLCSVSDFFSAALNGEFKEAEVGAVKLPEHDPDTFQYFVHWLYEKKLTGYFRTKASPSIKVLKAAAVDKAIVYRATRSEHDGDAMKVADGAMYLAIFEEAPLEQLVSLYIFADALQVRGLKDHIVSVIVKVYGVGFFRPAMYWDYCMKFDTLPDPGLTLSAIYERLPSTSSLRRFLVDFYLSNISDNGIAVNRGKLHPDFVYDTFEALHKRQIEALDDTKFVSHDFEEPEVICRYHEHDVECLLETRDILKSQVTDW